MISLKEQLGKLLNKAEYKELLWTNTVATSSMAAQTIQLDLSSFEYVEIWFFQGGTADALVPNPLKIRIGEHRNILLVHSINGAGVNENTGARLVTASATGVTFGNYGYKNRRSGGTVTISNGFAVPRFIYGVKHVGGVARLLRLLTAERGWARG